MLIVALGFLAGVWATLRLRTLPVGGPGLQVPISVVIPARNEASRLPSLLASLQPWPADVEVIVVDDGSTDETAAEAQRFGATVVAAPPAPSGWLGKPWACWVGAGSANGGRFVFLDADTELAPGALDRLASAHEHWAPDGLLSVQPRHRTVQAYEQASAVPNVVSLMGSWCFAPGGQARNGVAFGPCLVTSAADYFAVGGHATVAGQLIEDLHLGRAYRAAGRPVRGFVGGDAIRFRMYPAGPAQLVEGWTKNLTGGARLAPLAGTIAAALWVTAGISIAMAAGQTVADRFGGLPLDPWAVAWWAAYAGHLHWLLRRVGSFRWWTAWAFPLPLLAFLGLFVLSAFRRIVRREVSWSGRVISVRRTRG